MIKKGYKIFEIWINKDDLSKLEGYLIKGVNTDG